MRCIEDAATSLFQIHLQVEKGTCRRRLSSAQGLLLASTLILGMLSVLVQLCGRDLGLGMGYSSLGGWVASPSRESHKGGFAGMSAEALHWQVALSALKEHSKNLCSGWNIGKKGSPNLPIIAIWSFQSSRSILGKPFKYQALCPLPFPAIC